MSIEKLPRSLSLFSASMLGLGAMIGAGIFLLSGIAAGHAGPAVILAFIFNGLIAAAIGGCYAELASAMPRAGGSYYWIKQSLGERSGFAVGWISLYANAVAAALYALGFGAFLQALLEYFQLIPNDYLFYEGSDLSIIAAVLVTTTVTLLHYFGSKDTSLAENIITVLKIMLLLVLIGGGLMLIHQQKSVAVAFTPFVPNGIQGITMAMAITFVAFEGFEVITRTGEELINPEKNMPRAIFISIAVAVSLYVLIGIVLIAAVKGDNQQASWQYLSGLGELGMATSAKQLIPYGDVLFYVAGVASTMSAMIAATFSAIRVAFAMGRQKDLPTQLSYLHARHHSPYIAVLLCGLIVMLMIITLPVIEVAGAASQMFALLFTLVCIGAWRLRISQPNLPRPFRLAALPLMASVGIISGTVVFFMLLNISPLSWGISVGWMLVGVVVYYYKKHSYGVKLHD
jgi:APA family basic amino acid/polyamine antiporter